MAERPLIVDVHAHTPAFLPRLPWRIYRWFLRRTAPPVQTLRARADAGVDVAVVAAVGDRFITRLRLRRGMRAVRSQLRLMRVDAKASGLAVALLPSDLGTTPSVLLALEGGDAIGRKLANIDTLAADGVRMITPVHLGNNRIGTTVRPWQAYVLRGMQRHKRGGLSDFGVRAVNRMNDRGIIIDVSHCDSATTLDITRATRAPVIASHSGARSVEDFDRFLGDDEIRAIAQTGGLIGLWPYRHAGEGARGLDDLVAHARHIAGLVGTQALCIGTDANGVPGVAKGTGTANDVSGIAAALRNGGFSKADVDGILGGNFQRCFAAVTAAAVEKSLVHESA